MDLVFFFAYGFNSKLIRNLLIDLKALLLASIWHYERVSFGGKTLPWFYEIIAWITMVCPLFIVPFIIIHSLYLAHCNGKVYFYDYYSFII